MADTQNFGAYSAAPELGLHGKWPPEVRMSGLEGLAQTCAGKTVLDLGTAEGLIALRFLKGGAAVLHGVDVVPERVIAARRVCQDFINAQFWQADLSEWKAFWFSHAERMLPRYDIVLYLGVHHHLPVEARAATLVNAAGLSSDVIALRTRESFYRDEDLNGRLTGLGFRLINECRNSAVAGLGALRIFSRCAQTEAQP